MIYLIDDNQNSQRQNQYNINFIEDGTFNGYLTSVERIEKREKANDILHLKFLQNAKCILLHITTEDWDVEKGFLSGSTSNVRKIKEEIADFGDKIPLVLFSNNMGEPEVENPHFIRGIKKNLFYEHLKVFVEYYKNTGEIELQILAWGKNFQAKEVRNIGNIVLEAIISQKNTDKLDLKNLPKQFQEFIKLSFSNISYEVFLDDLEKNPVTISEFREKIQSIIESYLQYGENIYTW